MGAVPSGTADHESPLQFLLVMMANREVFNERLA